MVWEVLRWLNVAFATMALAGLATETKCYWWETYCTKERWTLITLYAVTIGLMTFSIMEMVDSRGEKIFSVASLILLALMCVRNTIDYPKWTLVSARPKKEESTRLST